MVDLPENVGSGEPGLTNDPAKTMAGRPGGVRSCRDPLLPPGVGVAQGVSPAARVPYNGPMETNRGSDGRR